MKKYKSRNEEAFGDTHTPKALLLVHFVLLDFADMLSVSGRSVLVVSDTNKNYFSAEFLERIGIMPVFYLLDSSFGIFISFQLDNEYGITRIIFRQISDIRIPCSGRKLLPLDVVVTVGIVSELDNAAKTVLLVVMDR